MINNYHLTNPCLAETVYNFISFTHCFLTISFPDTPAIINLHLPLYMHPYLIRCVYVHAICPCCCKRLLTVSLAQRRLCAKPTHPCHVGKAYHISCTCTSRLYQVQDTPVYDTCAHTSVLHGQDEDVDIDHPCIAPTWR